MQTQGVILGKPQTIVVIWWDQLNQSERVSSHQISLPSWEAVISWAESQRDIAIYIRAE
jgi:hypothetical protein